MAIPLPNLDDRRWTDLVEEGRALIPVYAPGWTDHNPSDPGITLLELFAFVTENLLYRANRVPDRQRRRLLALAGVRQRGPSPSHVLLSFGTGTVREIPAGTICSGADASGGRVMFRTLATVTAVPGEVHFVEEAGRSVTVSLSEPVPAGTRLSLGFIVRADGASVAERQRLIEDDSPLTHHSVRLRWECQGSGWEHLEDVEDGTRALTLDGVVSFTAPVATSTFRVTVDSGEYDRIREVLTVFSNAVDAEQSVYSSVQAVAVAAGDGSPFQKVGLPGAPVIEESVIVETDDGIWERRDDLAASSPAARHYLLDATRGQVMFGDGNQGRAPEQGIEIRARYLQTRAADGHAAAYAVDRIEDGALADVEVTNPQPSEGGASAETLDAAIGRVRLLREASLRAVTLQDIETVALATPGADIARVSARANMYPGLACANALGVITIIVLPASTDAHPMPSAGLLAYIARRLDRVRVIGTRFVVTGPEYVKIVVHAQVKMLAGVKREAVRARVLEALRRFFDPMVWPFGRDVYRSEVLQALDGVEGVDYIEKLELGADNCQPSCGNICMPGTALVAEGAHQIEVKS